MKKSLVTGLAILTLLPQVVAAAAVNMTYNGSPIYADVPPIIRNDRTFVPLRFLSETLGYKVGWDNATRTATVSGQAEIRLTIGKTTALVNGEEKSLDVAPFIEKERTMVPIRFIAENMEGNITWDQDTKTVNMTGPELPKAQPITVTFEGKEILHIENPKMIGKTPMIPVRQFIEELNKFPQFITVDPDLEVGFGYHYEPASPENYDIDIISMLFCAEVTCGELMYSPEYDAFRGAHESYDPTFRSKIHPIVEGEDLYVDPVLLSYIFQFPLTQHGTTYHYRDTVFQMTVGEEAIAKQWDPTQEFNGDYDLLDKHYWPDDLLSTYFKNIDKKLR